MNIKKQFPILLALLTFVSIFANQPIKIATPISEMAERVQKALCPTMNPDFLTIFYFDKRPSINLEGKGFCHGYRMVFSENAEVYLSDEDPSPTRMGNPIMIKEYIEIVIFKSDQNLPINTQDLIPWTGFTSFYYLQPVDMGTGFGFHWYGRMHLWEQDDLRERLGLIGGEDRHTLAIQGTSVKDRGRMTANSMDSRMYRFKQKL